MVTSIQSLCKICIEIDADRDRKRYESVDEDNEQINVVHFNIYYCIRNATDEESMNLRHILLFREKKIVQNGV